MLSLPLVSRAFFVFFCGVAIYTVGLSLHVSLRLRSLKKHSALGRSSSTQSTIHLLRKRLQNLRQMQLFALYAFGFCVASFLPNMFYSIDVTGSHSITREVTFRVYCTAAILVGFLVIHGVQWLAISSMESFNNRRG